MNWPFTYTPYLWLVLVSIAIILALIPFSLRRRSVPGALPFAVMMMCVLPWATGNLLKLVMVDIPLRIIWIKPQFVLALMIATTRLCFALEYAHLNRWLTRRNLALLSIPPLACFFLLIGNDSHHLLWGEYAYPERASSHLGPLGWGLAVYGFLTVAVVLAVLIWYFIQSPLQRWPVALVICGQLIANLFFAFEFLPTNSVAPVDPVVLGNVIASIMYALALFGFRMFDPLPVAREMVISQMQEGMLVLDIQQHIVGSNPAAERILGLAAAQIYGQKANEILLGCDPGSETFPTEISLESNNSARHYQLRLSPLKDRQNQALGHLLLLADISEQKHAQAQILEQQKALATFTERERLARELHDSIGQVLGYAGFQVDAARKLIAAGQLATADQQLARLGSVVQDAHADVREYILNLRASPSGQSFFAALQHYLEGYCQNYNIHAELILGKDFKESDIEPDAQAQLFRIIQEALSNARKHASARHVQVSFTKEEHQVRVCIQDDGQGFDPVQTAGGNGSHFGLQFMRERAEQSGGDFQVQSAPGKGTRIFIELPLKLEEICESS
jgi:PAS domain S-box-containing protein